MAKRHELEFVVEVLTEQFRKKIANRQSAKLRNAKILKIILFGSYSRDDWVEDPIGRYYSDFDLLIVTSNEDSADFAEYWADTEMMLMRELGEGKQLKTPVSLIVHSLADVNEQLERGRYFFVDIARDGIPLLAVPGHPFVEPKALPAEAALLEVQEYFADGTRTAEGRVAALDLFVGRGDFGLAAFEAHQAAEVLYQTLLLVTTLHTPKSHNLSRLRQLTEPIDDRLRDIWPINDK
ncbi:MAG: nucleotidyltransferase domain-containing protein, partial [Caulobacter sp.]